MDKSKKAIKKKSRKMDKKCSQYDSIIHDNVIKEFFQAKTPHVILSNKTFNDIKLNVVMLTNPQIEHIPKNQMIHYKIKYMGDNIHVSKKGKYYNLKPCCTKRNMIFVLIAIHEVMYMDNLIFFTEMGDMISQTDIDKNRHGYVMLAAILVRKTWQKKDILITDRRYELVNKFYFNQIKQNQGNYHFGTSGKIFGLGYGPKCHKNEHGHSIDRYSNSKYFFFHLQYIVNCIPHF